MQKRLLLACDSLCEANGGVSRVARLSAKVLAELARDTRLQVNAVTLNDAQPVSNLGIPVVTAAGSRMRFLGLIQLAATSHSHFLFDCCGMGRAHILGRLLKRRIACWIHGVEIWQESNMSTLKQKKRRVAKAADMLIANSRTTVDRSGYSHARCCWLGTDTDEFAPAPTADRPPRALLLATIDVDYKGHRELLNCWQEVKSRVPEAVLTFAGKGPGLASLRRSVAQHPCADSIEVLGFVPEAELDRMYRSCRVLAMPSRGEGFGLVYIEAMRHGLPVIASIHDAGAEINLDGTTGFNVNLDQPGDLPKRLIQLLSDAQLARYLGEKGQCRWNREFSYGCFRSRFSPLVGEFLQL